jgi:hypothetical protein
MAKQPSRPKRWAEAVAQAMVAVEAMEVAAGSLNEAVSDLRDLQEEYQDWLDNLPENLQHGALAEKLQAITELDLDDVESMFDEAIGKIDEAEGVELPQGFGRD